MCKSLDEMQLFKETFKLLTTWETATYTLFSIQREFYPNITKYKKILVTMPISVATVERSSKLKILKTSIRSQNNLLVLTLLYIPR